MAGAYSAPNWLTQFIQTIERAFTPRAGQGRLERPRHPRMIAGVCSGIAAHFAWDVQIFRIVVVVLTIASSGLPILAYAAAWILIPEGQYSLPADAGAPRS